MSRYFHFGHLKDISVPLNKYVKRGELLGHIGTSGNSTGPHLHFEVMKGKPKAWRQYVRGLSYSRVLASYEDPSKFVKDGFPAENSFPKAGYGFMQYVKTGGYYHPGVDLNGLSDLGKPVYAPVNGRVVFLETVSPIKNWLGKIIKYTDWNGGWGRHIWLESDEQNLGVKV